MRVTHLLHCFHVPDTVLNGLSHFFFTPLYIISIIFTLILQIRRLRHGEVNQFSQDNTDTIAPEPILLTYTLVCYPEI